METILITGTSGFIGFHTAKKLLDLGYNIVGIDNENFYYDIRLKTSRRELLEKYPNFHFYKTDIEDFTRLSQIFTEYQFSHIIHLAAQAGVRYSITNPEVYIQSNILGFYNIIELARRNSVRNFIFASSSSVYGNNEKQPFSTNDNVDHPISLYAATKKSNELIAHSYSHLFGINTIGLRFFTVYGPWGRPDMAYYKFTKNILEGNSIDVYNHGNMKRDFTYIDDIVSGILSCLDKNFGYKILNLGNDTPEKLEDMISYIENSLGKKSKKNYLEMQAGDVLVTWSDIEETKKYLNWKPTTKLSTGIEKFCEWYKNYNNIK